MAVEGESGPEPTVAFRREIEAPGFLDEKALAQSLARLFIWRYERKDVG